MFDGCNSINNLDLSKWNTQNVYNVSWMFSVTFKLTNLKGIENCLCSK
ncbi:BspA family leucine-rich repeat surface protein [Holdemanella porci]